MKKYLFVLGMSFCLLAFAGADKGMAASQADIAPGALEQLLSLATGGDVKAQTRLGNLYFQGSGVPQNYEQAVAWFRKAADQGYVSAQYDLGLMYRFGKGVPQDDKEAAKWLGLAADQGNAAAQNRLAAMYVLGKGVPQDETEGARWYRLAAEQGVVSAERQLGLMYMLGRGVPQNDDAAMEWLRRAADQGDAVAKSKLAMLPLYKGAADAVDRAYESNPPRDASSPIAAVAMMKATLDGAAEMRAHCIKLHTDLQPEIDQDLATWKSTEAHAIAQTESHWPSWVATHPELGQIATSLDQLGIQASLDKMTAANSQVGTQLLCRKYFSDLASGIWRKRTPKAYQFLDSMS